MADLSLRSYLHGRKMERVGLNRRRKFPDLAGDKAVLVTIYFQHHAGLGVSWPRRGLGL